MWEFVKVTFWLGLVLMIVMFAVVQPYLKAEKRRIAALQQVHDRAFPIWRRLRFCSRCSNVYDPSSGCYLSEARAWQLACDVSSF
jgi:hypothetical protein